MKLSQLIERLQKIAERDPAMPDAEVYITVEVTEEGVPHPLTTQHEQPLDDVACVVPKTRFSGVVREATVYLLGPGI